jgi:hypothetical protein
VTFTPYWYCEGQITSLSLGTEEQENRDCEHPVVHTLSEVVRIYFNPSLHDFPKI